MSKKNTLKDKSEELKRTLSIDSDDNDYLDFAKGFSSPPKKVVQKNGPIEAEKKGEGKNGNEDTQYIDIDSLSPSPREWNFYDPLKENEMNELIDSIIDIGLHHPIVVWDRGDKKLILSGHNRWQAYRTLNELNPSGEYKRIKAIVYDNEDIDEERAKSIIVDINWNTRKLNTREKVQSINFKIDYLKKNKKSMGIKGRVRDFTADSYDMSGRMLDNYRRLVTLHEPFFDLIDSRHLSVVAATNIAALDEDIQEWLAEKYKYKLNSTLAKKITKEMSKDDIRHLLLGKKEADSEAVNIKVKVPKKFVKDFEKFAYEWATERLEEDDVFEYKI